MKTVIPQTSQQTLSGIDFSSTTSVASDLVQLFHQTDLGAAKKDPSNCVEILKFPNGAIFWSSKSATDADGLNGVALDSADGQNDSSYHVEGKPLNSFLHPYVVLPLGSFRAETGLQLGDLFVIVYKNQITCGLAGDLGPHSKIGETSIRVHTGLQPAAPAPVHYDANGNPTRIIDVSIPNGVLYFGFPNSAIPGLTAENLETFVKAKAYSLFATLQTK